MDTLGRGFSLLYLDRSTAVIYSPEILEKWEQKPVRKLELQNLTQTVKCMSGPNCFVASTPLHGTF